MLVDEPEKPEALSYLFDWFMELARTRHCTMTGPQPITYHEIDAWARVTRRAVYPHEIDALAILDHAALHPDPPKVEDAAPAVTPEEWAQQNAWPTRTPDNGR